MSAEPRSGAMLAKRPLCRANSTITHAPSIEILSDDTGVTRGHPIAQEMEDSITSADIPNPNHQWQFPEFSASSSDNQIDKGKQRNPSVSAEQPGSSGGRTTLLKKIRRTSMSIRSMLQHTPGRSARESGTSPSRKNSSATERYGEPSSSMAAEIASRCRAALHLSQSTRADYSAHPPQFNGIADGGGAARAAAASANQEFYGAKQRNDSNIALPRLSADNRESGVDVVDDGESINGDVRRNSHMYRKDPLSCLPMEIASLVFKHLDVASLAKAARVSKRWSSVAADQHVWRSIFLNKFEPKPRSCPLPLTVGGIGTGKPKVWDQDWKNMFKARADLESNWAQGNAMAIYLNGHTDSVYCVQYNEDIIITGSRDRTFRIWDINTFKCIKVVGIPSARETDLREMGSHMPHPPLLPEDHVIHPNPARELDPSIYHVPSYYHDASILCLQFDDEIMVTGSSDCTLIVWDVKTWQPIHRLRSHTAGVLDIAFDKEKIVSCSKDATLCVWDRATGELLQRITGHMGPVNAVQLRGNLVISASGEGCARLWNLGYQRRRRRSSVGGGFLDRPTCDAKCVKEFWSKDRGLACVEFSDDARYVLAGGNDQVIYKFDTQTGKRMEFAKGHENLVRSLYLDEANGRVVSGSYDSSLRVWDYERGAMTMCFPHWTNSWMLSAKSDYRRIVCTSQDGRALILDFGFKVEGVDLLRGS